MSDNGVKSAKVRITYELETGGALEERELPFVIGVLAHLSGDADAKSRPLEERRFVELGCGNFDSVLRSVSPRVSLEGVDDLLNGEGRLRGELIIEEMEDFTPARIAMRHPLLRQWCERRERAAGKEQIQIDRAIGAQFDAMLHAEGFQRLEATWRGLHRLVKRVGSGGGVVIRVLNVSKAELQEDFARAKALDESALFRLVYEAEYGTYGGNPYGLLAGDYEFGGAPEEVALLARMAELGAAAHVPFVAAAGAALLGLKSFGDLHKPRSLKKTFDSVDLSAWREFRETEDSRYLVLTLPRVLARPPYGASEGAGFDEAVTDGSGEPDPKKLLWGSSALVAAECLSASFVRHGWLGEIGSVVAEGLPVINYVSPEGTAEQAGPTEVVITDLREHELRELGFMGLCQRKGSARAAFFSAQTTHLPTRFVAEDANARARVAASLPAVLAATRFAHYVKVMMRERIGSLRTRAEIDACLNGWIGQYVLPDEGMAPEARHPLRSAHVVVTDVPGEPGSYVAMLAIETGFQQGAMAAPIAMRVSLAR